MHSLCWIEKANKREASVIKQIWSIRHVSFYSSTRLDSIENWDIFWSGEGIEFRVTFWINFDFGNWNCLYFNFNFNLIIFRTLELFFWEFWAAFPRQKPGMEWVKNENFNFIFLAKNLQLPCTTVLIKFMPGMGLVGVKQNLKKKIS